MTDELIEQVAELQLAAFLAGRGSVTGMKHGTRVAKPAPSMDDFRRMAQSAILPIIKAERIRGGEMVKEAAAVAYQTEAETWLQLPTRGACSRLGAKVIRALSVPAIVEAGEHQPKENTDASSD